MKLQQYLVLAGAALTLTGWLTYVRNTLAGTTKPNRMTYLMWSVAPLIATAAALTKGVRWAAIPVFMSGFCPFMVLVASYRNRVAYWKLGKLDYACGILSALALILWGVTQQPELAIIFAIAGDGLAAAPTLIKAWSHPQTETGVAYAFAAISAGTSFAAAPQWSFAEVGFAAYLVILNAAIWLSIYGATWFRNVEGRG
jgi:hypothetical protein